MRRIKQHKRVACRQSQIIAYTMYSFIRLPCHGITVIAKCNLYHNQPLYCFMLLISIHIIDYSKIPLQQIFMQTIIFNTCHLYCSIYITYYKHVLLYSTIQQYPPLHKYGQHQIPNTTTHLFVLKSQVPPAKPGA